MSADVVILSFAVIVAAWVTYFMWRLTMSFPSITVIRSSTRPRPRALCGYHLASESRPGLSAVVDSTRCEYCRSDDAMVKAMGKQTPDDAA